MVSRSDRDRPRDPVSQGHMACPSDPPSQPCGDGGLDAVLGSRELDLAVAHFLQCTPCQREFIAHGGLLAQRSALSRRGQQTPDGPVQEAVGATAAVLATGASAGPRRAFWVTGGQGSAAIASGQWARCPCPGCPSVPASGGVRLQPASALSWRQRSRAVRNCPPSWCRRLSTTAGRSPKSAAAPKT